MGMLCVILKVIKILLFAAIWTTYHHMIMGPPEESVESQHSYCPNDDKTWCKYHKDKIFHTKTYDRSKCLPFVFRGELHEIFKRLIFLFGKSIIKWNEGAHGRKSFLESLDIKCGPNVIAGLRKENSLRLSNARCKITEKYKKRRQVLGQLRNQNKKDNS